VQEDTVDIPSITSGAAFDEFRSEGISILLYEAESQTLGLQKMEGTVIETNP
jgi:hypothetical protein